MSRKVYDVRLYPAVSSGFDIIARVRGGIMKLGNYPTIEAALAAAQMTEGKKPMQPVYVYPRSLPAMMAEAVAPALGATPEGGEV